MKRILLVFPFILIGCSDGFNDQKETPITLKSRVIKESFGEYFMEITLPQGEYTIEKRSESGDEKIVLTSSAINSFEDRNVGSGDTYVYYITENQSGQTKELIAQIPLDIDTGSEKSTNHLTKAVGSISKKDPSFKELIIDELILSEDQPLYLGEGNALITINKIISNGGMISNFPSDSASENKTGRSGGNKILNINKISGEITFIANGENGSDGLRPAPIGERGRGAKGDRGESGLYTRHFSKSGGFTFITPYCKRHPGIGYQGKQGLPGLPGTNGNSGGNSGAMEVSIEDSSDAIVNFDLIPGLGGDGSIGGEGGPGGHGGDPGLVIFEPSNLLMTKNPCVNPEQGPEGPKGPNGAPGLPGEDGEFETICIYLNDQNKKTCK